MFINSQFNYVPLLWTFCRKTFHHKTENIYDKTLQIICQSEEPYKNLIGKSSSFCTTNTSAFISSKNLQKYHAINPKLMWPYFTYNNSTYNLRRGPILFCLARIQHIAIIIPFILRGCLIWNNLPRDSKSIKSSVSEFKTKIKNFGNIDCGYVIYS